MNVHPLRQAYLSAVRERYNVKVWGDKDPCRTEQAAMKIKAMGLDYVMYIDLALKLSERTARYYNCPYPYWNMVIGDKTMDKVRGLLKLTPATTLSNDNLDDEEAAFEAELSYAVDYVEWWFGRGDKPHHCGDVTLATKARVAEYLCRMWGVPYTSSNYNVLCKELETNGR